jgi:hypothetical protein
MYRMEWKWNDCASTLNASDARISGYVSISIHHVRSLDFTYGLYEPLFVL